MSKPRMRLGRWYVCAFGFFLVLSLGLDQAQGQVSISGEVTGVVTDNTGAVVPGATVRATNVGTNVSTDTLTNGAGLYRILTLIPGTYSISVERSGFKRFLRQNVDIAVDTITRVDPVLEVGTLSQSVVVTASAPMLKTDRADVSETLGNTQIEDLPTLGRNVTRLVQLVPGASQASSQLTGWVENAGNDYQTNINGQPGDNSNRQLDGVDNNETIQGLSVVVPTEDSVQEIKVTTGNYDAEYGQVSGAVIQVSTKSGTNDWHGSLFDFYQSSGLFARNPFSEPHRPAHYVWQQFGGSEGGRIVKDKLFFFADYQGLRSVNGASVLTTVPTAAMRTGDFSAFASTYPVFDPNTGDPDGTGRVQFSDPSRATASNPLGLNIIPLNRIDPAALKLLAYIPMPNNPNSSLTANNFTVSGGGLLGNNQLDGRVDYNPSNKNRLFGRYSLYKYNEDIPAAFGNVIGGSPLGGIISGLGTTQNQNWVGNYTRLWSPTLLTVVDFGFSRDNLQNVTLNANLQTANAIGMNGINITGTELTNGIPNISVGGPVGGFSTTQGLPFLEVETNVHLVNNWTKTSGNHTFKWGVNVGKAFLRRRDTTGRGSESISQSVTESAAIPGSGLGMASFLLGDVSSFSRVITLQIVQEKQWRDGAYVQDQWTVNRKLSLMLGLRWDYFSPEFSTNPAAGTANISNLDTATGNVVLGGYNGDKYAGVTPLYTEFDPRVGLAYRLGSRSVFRAGFGRSHAIDDGGANLGRLFRNWPLQQSQSVTAATVYQPAFSFEQGPPAPAAIPAFPTSGLVPVPPNSTLAFLYPGLGHYRHTEVDAYNAALQHQLRGNMTLELAYVANLGRHLYDNYLSNAAVPGPGPLNPRRPFFNKFGWSSNGLSLFGDVGHEHSLYSALQFKFEKQFSHDFLALINFTYDKAEDMPIQNQFNFDSNWGNSSNTPNLIYSGSFLYGLPFGPNKLIGSQVRGIPRQIIRGWKLNGIVSLMSGVWFTPTYSDTSGYNSDCCTLRPSRIGSGKISNPSRNMWFNPSAFVRPPNYTYGNSGRNILQGPGWADVDLSLFKECQITEKVKLEVRMEAFNAFNRTNLSNPTASVTSTVAGVISSTIYPMRRVQIGARLFW